MKKALAGLFVLLILLVITCNTFEGQKSSGSSAVNEVTAAGVTMQWRVEGSNLAVTLTAATTGWVAVGFNPTMAMQGANIIIGEVHNNIVTIEDDFGTGPNDHNADTALGGTDNVINLGGSETNGVTEIRFKIPLDSGDPNDRPLAIGNTYKIMLARALVDFLTTQHAARDYAFIKIQ